MTDTPHDDFEKMLADALGTSEHDTIDRAVRDLDADADVPEGFRSGYVAVVGRPNVGKSTLLNALLGEKVAIVSPKPGTTRIQQLGILTRDDAQIIFVDTPGIHKAQDNLSEFMVEVAKAALEDADVILFVCDTSEPPNTMDKQIAEYVRGVGDMGKVLHVLNKVDALKDPAKFARNFEAYRELVPDADFASTAAVDGHNVPQVLEKVLAKLPTGPRYYPRDQVSDVPVRALMAEMLREQVLLKTEQEVPHAIAVEVEEFKRRRDDLIYINATIYTERDGQKGIIIGKGGAMLKKIASSARTEMESFLGSKVFLDVHVKVLPNWRRDEAALRRFGYRLGG